MEKMTISQEQAQKIIREAQEIRQMTKTPGWQLIVTEIKAQMDQVKTLLVGNSIRTVHETVVTGEGATKTIITTQESQVAEHAGMYRMAQYILDLVAKVENGENEMNKVLKEGLITIEGSTHTEGGENHDRRTEEKPSSRTGKSAKR